MKLSKRTKKIMIAAVSVIVLAFLCSLTAFADGEVAGAVESTWNAARDRSRPLSTMWCSRWLMSFWRFCCL